MEATKAARKSPVEKHDIYFKKHPVGAGILILIGLIGDQMSDPEVSRTFPHSAELYHRLMFFVEDWIGEWCRRHSHEEKGICSEEIIYHRYHKMYWIDRNGIRGKRSNEHYLGNDRLRPFVDKTEELFKRGRKITEQELREAMEGYK